MLDKTSIQGLFFLGQPVFFPQCSIKGPVDINGMRFSTSLMSLLSSSQW